MNDRLDPGFVEVADGCFAARYPEWDVTVGVVVGAAGALVVDTRATAGQGARLRDDVRRLAPQAEINWVVNTHQHFDHTFGNIAFVGAAVHAHENVASGLVSAAERIKRLIAERPEPDPGHPAITAQVLRDVVDTELRFPDVTFSSVATIDLGDRYVELVHPGRGHTDGDIVVRVPDAEVLFAGDLVEESGPPVFGADCYPMDWAASVDLVVGMLAAVTVVVPGHGTPVDRDFVESQRADISDIAELIRSLAAQGVPADQALREGDRAGWPFPAEGLEHAVRRGYEHLTASGAPLSPAQPPSGAPSLPLAGL
ncbi:MAG: MBL fold metallo-hydrolase [Nocardioidaceae bacterium]|nr:MBL fold metallo-hydrolase [Nocardioidaceae bacterium]